MTCPEGHDPHSSRRCVSLLTSTCLVTFWSPAPCPAATRGTDATFITAVTSSTHGRVIRGTEHKGLEGRPEGGNGDGAPQQGPFPLSGSPQPAKKLYISILDQYVILNS
uniref:Uncharacterized protein n=1 Tax=Timema genevievae TaxID=629358 RepID=A0A7R9JSG9_TIMGE|nr:unnamed protein product [Timema genevievae]